MIDIVALDTPVVAVPHSYSDNAWKYFAFELTTTCCADLLQSPTAQRHVQDVDAALQLWRANGTISPNVPNPSCVLMLPYPYSNFLAMGLMKSVAMQIHDKCEKDCQLAPWFQFVKNACLVHPDTIECIRSDPIHDINILGRQLFRDLASQLKTWAPSVQRDFPNDVETLESYVMWLEQLASALSLQSFIDFSWQQTLGRGGHLDRASGKRGRYDVAFLFHCLIVCFDNMHFEGDRTEQPGVSQGTPMKRMIHKMFECLPGVYRNSLNDALKEARFPSRSTLCRMRLYVDVVWMRVWRKLFRELLSSALLPAVIAIPDSSPQGGRNWMILILIIISGNALESAGEAALALKSFPKTDNFLENQLALMSEYFSAIREALQICVCPPACLGARKAGSRSKVHTVVHILRLLNFDFRLVRDLLNCFELWLADLGEKKLRQYHIPSPYRCFPWWQDSDTMAADDMADTGGIGVEINNPVLQDDVPINLGHGMFAPGIFHAAENIKKRVLDKLDIWEDVKPHLSSFCHYFHKPHLKNEFSQLVLVDANQQWERMFSSSPPMLEGGRTWGTLGLIFAWKSARRQILRDIWPQDLLDAAGGGADVDEGDGQTNKFDDSGHRRRVNQAIPMAYYWGCCTVLEVFTQFVERLEGWGRRCTCHSSELLDHFGVKREKVDCPLCGCTMIELTFGDEDKTLI